MIFIITLIALTMERFFHWHHLRQWRWFMGYERWFSRFFTSWPPLLVFLINILPPLIVVGVINWMLSGVFSGILALIFGVFVLLYCLGPQNLWVQVYRCIQTLNKDDPSAAVPEVQAIFGIDSSDHSQTFHKKFVIAIFTAAEQRIFAVLFWFVLLGPVGAVLYRLTDSFSIHAAFGLSQTASQAKKILDWLPLRIYTFLFALGGNFTKVFNRWKQYAIKGIAANQAMLAECGLAALDIEVEMIPESGLAEREALLLLDRVFIMWLVILAVFVLCLA